MRKPSIIRRSAAFRCVAAGLVFSCIASLSWGQSCVYRFTESFQTYGSTSGTIYVTASVVDNSGCNHSSYSTTATISLPNGQSNSATSTGLMSSVSLVPNDPGPGDNGFISISNSTSGTFYCSAFHGTAGFGGGQPVTLPWATIFGIANDGQNVVFEQSDFNYLVSQGILPAAAGTVVLVTQPELYPVIGTAIVIVALGYLTYKAAKSISQAIQQSRVNSPVNIKQACLDQLYKCIDYPNQPNTGYGSRKDCNACYGECVNAGGVWPYYKCQP